MSWLWLSAALMLVTAVTHSVVGERRLVGPMMRERQGVMASRFARTIIRYAWHVTSALMAACALTVAWPNVPAALIVTIGAIWLGLGLTSLVASKGKHIGWPVLTAAGVCGMIGGWR